ncbi:MAG: alpha/beta fold hydrolase [Rhodococcus sp. (in: high G+C Gram-positive bacteria)]|uniref:alpha/beta fold hydrolase n=1 Tax=Rhodococcus sp. TaxID=1831 RepID=UPI003BAEED88
MRWHRIASVVAIASAWLGVCSATQTTPAASAELVPSPPGAISVATVPEVTGPQQSTHPDASRYSRRTVGSVPSGVNDFSCTPTPMHPRPVVLAHGSDSNAYSDWAALGPRLANSGYCVFALDYGGKPGADNYGTEDMTLSGEQVANFVDRVLTATGASQLDIVGYSQGATVSRYYMNRLGGAAKVNQWIGLASPTYGGTLYGVTPLLDRIPGALEALSALLPATLLAPAVAQQREGSDFMETLNRGGDTVPGPKYTTIGSRVDEVIQPTSSMALRGPGATNIVVQDLCPQNLSGHFRMPYDEFTLQLIVNTLDPSTAVPPVCAPVPLGAGVVEMIIADNS